MVKVRDNKLSKGKAKVIAFLSESILPTEISKNLEYALTYAQEKRSCTIRYVPNEPTAQPAIFAGYDGILAGVVNPQSINLVKATGLPVVTTSLSDYADLACVEFSPEMTGTMAAEWFLHRRFTNFAFCGTFGYSFYERIERAFSAALRDAGFDCITCDRGKDDNIDQRIALGDLAAAAGISQSALQNAIHKTFGMSVNKYILSVKMREAKRLIDHGGYSVKELAARTGFSTQSYFTRAYTAYYGRPPSKTRQ